VKYWSPVYPTPHPQLPPYRRTLSWNFFFFRGVFTIMCKHVLYRNVPEGSDITGGCLDQRAAARSGLSPRTIERIWHASGPSKTTAFLLVQLHSEGGGGWVPSLYSNINNPFCNHSTAFSKYPSKRIKNFFLKIKNSRRKYN
jgi:hypothetical protein